MIPFCISSKLMSAYTIAVVAGDSWPSCIWTYLKFPVFFNRATAIVCRVECMASFLGRRKREKAPHRSRKVGHSDVRNVRSVRRRLKRHRTLSRMCRTFRTATLNLILASRRCQIVNEAQTYGRPASAHNARNSHCNVRWQRTFHTLPGTANGRRTHPVSAYT